MRVLTILTLCLLLSSTAQAQFGFNARYLVPAENDWQYTTDIGPVSSMGKAYDRGWSAGIDFWFRLKNQRVEFTPEFNYTELTNSGLNLTQGETKVYSFFFNTNFYLWDFKGDCDCPTFSKQGPTLEKGLFIQLSPGVSYWDASYLNTIASIDDGSMVFSIGGGIGFDIGITDLVTITPILSARYFPEVKLEGSLITAEDVPVPDLPISFSASESPLLWSAGLRLGFRLDSDRY